MTLFQKNDRNPYNMLTGSSKLSLHPGLFLRLLVYGQMTALTPCYLFPTTNTCSLHLLPNPNSPAHSYHVMPVLSPQVTAYFFLSSLPALRGFSSSCSTGPQLQTNLGTLSLTSLLVPQIYSSGHMPINQHITPRPAHI